MILRDSCATSDAFSAASVEHQSTLPQSWRMQQAWLILDFWLECGQHAIVLNVQMCVPIPNCNFSWAPSFGVHCSLALAAALHTREEYLGAYPKRQECNQSKGLPASVTAFGVHVSAGMGRVRREVTRSLEACLMAVCARRARSSGEEVEGVLEVPGKGLSSTLRAVATDIVCRKAVVSHLLSMQWRHRNPITTFCL